MLALPLACSNAISRGEYNALMAKVDLANERARAEAMATIEKNGFSRMPSSELEPYRAFATTNGDGEDLCRADPEDAKEISIFVMRGGIAHRGRELVMKNVVTQGTASARVACAFLNGTSKTLEITTDRALMTLTRWPTYDFTGLERNATGDELAYLLEPKVESKKVLVREACPDPHAHYINELEPQASVRWIAFVALKPLPQRRVVLSFRQTHLDYDCTAPYRLPE